LEGGGNFFVIVFSTTYGKYIISTIFSIT